MLSIFAMLQLPSAGVELVVCWRDEELGSCHFQLSERDEELGSCHFQLSETGLMVTAGGSYRPSLRSASMQFSSATALCGCSGIVPITEPQVCRKGLK